MKTAKLFYPLAVFLLLCLAPASGQALMLESAKAGYRLELPEGWEKVELPAEQQAQLKRLVAGTPAESVTVAIFSKPMDEFVLIVLDNEIATASPSPDWQKNFVEGVLQSLGVQKADQKIAFSQNQAKSRVVIQGMPSALQVNFVNSHAVIMLGGSGKSDKLAELEMLMGKIRTKNPGDAPNALPAGQTGGQADPLPSDKPGLAEMLKFALYCAIGVGIGLIALRLYKKKFGSKK